MRTNHIVAGLLRARFSALFAIAAIVLAACIPMRPTAVPIPSVTFAAGEPDGVQLLLLPGIRDRPADFGDYGFDAVAAQHLPGVEITAVDAHFGYYRERSVVDRLVADVVKPDRPLIIAGISLGGFGALRYACDRGLVGIERLLLLAPYLGEREIIADVQAQGGLNTWQAGVAGEPHERELMTCLRDQPDLRRKIVIGIGDDDDFLAAARLLEPLLPTDQLIVTAGGHDWSTWGGLWPRVLEAGGYQRTDN